MLHADGIEIARCQLMHASEPIAQRTVEQVAAGGLLGVGAEGQVLGILNQ